MTYEAVRKGRQQAHGQQSQQSVAGLELRDAVRRRVSTGQGQEGAETAVEIINPKSIRIYNKRNGVLQQVVINTLSDDNNTINNEYIRMDKDGKITGVTHVTYIRRKK